MRFVLVLLITVVFVPAAHAGPRCFGAASRDPEHRCVNPRLARISNNPFWSLIDKIMSACAYF